MKSHNLSLGTTYVPRSSDFSQKRTEEIKVKHDILGKATIAGRKNEPRSDDTDLDETQRKLVDESQGFIGSATRIAANEITLRTNAAQALMPQLLETAQARANISRQVAEAKDLYRDDVEATSKEEQRAHRDLRTYEEDNDLAPYSAIYKDDRAMFFAMICLLVLLESVFNAFSFEELQDRGLVGGLMLALSVGVANVIMGLGTGYLGFRLLIHKQLKLRLLGTGITAALMTAALALHLALGDLREAITHNGKAQIDFLVVLKPWRWFGYTSIPPFVLFAVGLATYFVAALKGRGGSWGIVAPYWYHEVLDRRYKQTKQELENSKFNLKTGVQNAYDGQISKLTLRFDAETANGNEIRRILNEARGIERTMTDSIEDELARLEILIRMYRDRNLAVRTTPPPSYFRTYPNFDGLRRTRLDLGPLEEIAAKAEQVLAQNRIRLADLQEKVVSEQTQSIAAMLTTITNAVHRAEQQIEKDKDITKPLTAQRAD